MDTIDEIDGQNEFRKKEIEKMKLEVELEIEKRRKLLKSYKKISNVFEWSHTGLLCSSIIVAGVGAGGVITNVVSLPIAGVLGALGMGCKAVIPKLVLKVKKHKKKYFENEQKLMHINNLISKAIIDEEISASEFSLIVEELLKKVVV